jgi:preprotein translocase subunit SecA
MSFLSKIFGDANTKVIKELEGVVSKISLEEAAISSLSNEELVKKTADFKEALANGQTLDQLLPTAFAVVREASKRVLGQHQYDVQMMGGVVLHRGGVAEMGTGEGKTLTGVAAVYLNALTGKGVHVVTVNDYLAKRDAVWMGQIFHFLGLSVGVIQHESGYVYDENFKAEKLEDAERDTTGSFHVQMDFLRQVSRKEAYAADITYGTNNEFGFDYLRDNMAQSTEQMVQRPLHFALVDEVDSILIDEARTPLIISAPAEESANLYGTFAQIVPSLAENEHYNVDEKLRTATYTEAGLQMIEKALGVDNLYDQGLAMVHHAEQALRAHALYKIDRDYVVREGEVVIVDEFTGRLMVGRRYGEGLHQAIEAKEGVKVQRESRTLATITFQNYFRLYEKLAGMTGTAATEAEELSKIYNLEVTTVPTHKTKQRIDHPDRVYKNLTGKWLAVVKEVQERHAKGQPVLIGTSSIDKNELLSELLRAAGVPHKMLNAKNHEQEGEIIAQAGRRGGVTLATNMAGRGVDILLGGNPHTAEEAEEVRALGGLFVIGTERHESRRIDNQLRGRAGRQGDPGATQFYLSLEDDLMRIFNGDMTKRMMETLKIPEDMPIEAKMVTRALEKAQQRVESHNFDTRKHVLEYDDVLNKHRKVIYTERRALLDAEQVDGQSSLLPMMEKEIERVVFHHTVKVEQAVEEEGVDWNPQEIVEVVKTIITLTPDDEALVRSPLAVLSKDREELATQRTAAIEAIVGLIGREYQAAVEAIGEPKFVGNVVRSLHLRAIDLHWMRHLDDMTHLRRTIGLQGYAQRDPLVEYKKESFRMFTSMRQNIDRDVVYNVIRVLRQAGEARAMMQAAAKQVAPHATLGG